MSADDNTNHEARDGMLDELLPDHARDLLISRVIDGRASTSDWNRFRALAANEPEIWCELATTHQQHDSVRDELIDELSVADRIELPGGMIDEDGTRQRLSFVSKWGGWAIAATLIVVWSLGMPNASHTSQPGFIAGIPGVGLKDAEPEQAFEQYLDAGQRSGQVVAEMPEQVVVETTPLPDGTIEVLYLRQVIERRVIDQAYRMMQDETGNKIPVPVRVERGTYGTF